MLWLHIGMPKTGSTSIQGFLKEGDGSGFHYMKAGRRIRRRLAPSHNPVAFNLLRSPGAFDEARIEMGREYAEHGHETCVVSTEMLFGRPVEKWAPLFDGVPSDQIGITFFVRRPDLFVEADYKQRAKNGRAVQGAERYVRRAVPKILGDETQMNLAQFDHDLRRGFPGAVIRPLLYDGRDTLAAFCELTGLQKRLDLVGGIANRGFSRVASDALGEVATESGRFASRQVARSLADVDDDALRGRFDVLEWWERCALVAVLAHRNKAFTQTYFPDRERLYDMPGEEDGRTYVRDSVIEHERFERARELVSEARLVVSKSRDKELEAA